MRLIYFGSGTFGLPTLQRLSAVHDVALVVTQPDRPAGRHRALTPTPISEFAAARGLATIKPSNVNEPDVVARIQSVDASALVVIAFGQKLGPALLKDVFAINLHASLLPKYRGAAPIQWAIINGERETGLSVITLAERMDAGAILGQVSSPIDPMETAGELHDRLALMGPNLVLQVLASHERGETHSRPQDERLATHAPKLTKADGTVRFDQPAPAVRQRVHGVTPWPGCTVSLDGHPLRLARVAVTNETAPLGEPGAVLDDLTVACRPGAVRLLAVQPPGGKTMTFEAYCRGHKIGGGARFTSP